MAGNQARALHRAWLRYEERRMRENKKHADEMVSILDAWKQEVARIRHVPARGYTKPGIRARIAEAILDALGKRKKSANQCMGHWGSL